MLSKILINQRYRINCVAHMLNNTMHNALNQNDEAKEILEICRKIVTYFKRAGLQLKLSKTLKKDAPTRVGIQCSLC